jgi:hypothetical protein
LTTVYHQLGVLINIGSPSTVTHAINSGIATRRVVNQVKTEDNSICITPIIIGNIGEVVNDDLEPQEAIMVIPQVINGMSFIFMRFLSEQISEIYLQTTRSITPENSLLYDLCTKSSPMTERDMQIGDLKPYIRKVTKKGLKRRH